MASTFQMPSFYRSSHGLSVDTTSAQKYFEEDDSGILDENILDTSALDSGLEMSPPMGDSRRDSFGVAASIFSPKTEDWQSVDMQSVPSNNPFLEPQNTNPFTRVSSTQGYTGQWVGHTSGACTPLPQFDGMAEYEGSTAIFQRPISTQTPFSNSSAQMSLFSTGGPNNQTISTSPQKDWLGSDLKQSLSKQVRPGSPGIRSHNELRRGDGIRKKNARFDIPAERNLNNIDTLISQSTDEQEIKELKQQKRLLRNRQAALDSRQRKKLHTERLEDEKKHYTVLMTNMETDITELNLRMEQLLREKTCYENHIEGLRMEKEDLIRDHTIETGELRKKVNVLTEHVQRLESTSSANGANAFSHPYNEMEPLAMDTSWETMGFMENYSVEPETKTEMSIVPVKKQEVVLPAQVEKPSTQSGVLFMLFMVGAFVLSNRSGSGIPRASDDMREYSATLLDSIFKDAGVASSPDTVMANAPRPSGTSSWSSAPSVSLHGNGMATVAPSMLDSLTDSLIQPTEEQTTEQLFSLTPAQYNGVQSQEFLHNPPTRSTSQGRRNLAESLAAMRSNNDKQSAAEVYTRSLLWDQIPNDVVQNFARMVNDANRNSGGANHDGNS